jgi:hypothetical protein
LSEVKLLPSEESNQLISTELFGSISSKSIFLSESSDETSPPLISSSLS